MTQPSAIHAIEIIEIVLHTPGGIRLNDLAETTAARYGKSATFDTCTTQGMTFEALLKLLVMRHKLRITRGVVYPGRSPICKHCLAARNKQGMVEVRAAS